VFELGFLYLGFSRVFLLKKSVLIFKSPVSTLTLGTIHRELFSLKKSEGRSATVLCDKTVVHCN